MPDLEKKDDLTPESSRRSFLKQGLKGAALLPYVSPTIESIFLATSSSDADADDDDSDSNSGSSNSAPPSVIGNQPPPPKKKPKVKSVSPKEGFQGETLIVSIWGEDFSSGARVRFESGISVRQIRYISSDQLKVQIEIASYASEGKKDVTVTNSNGESDTKNNAFEIETRKAPQIKDISPDKGNQDSVLNVKIEGKYFQDGFQVSFGYDIRVLETRFFDDEHIGARIDIGYSASPGDRNVTVINPDRQEDTDYNAFEVKKQKSKKKSSRYEQDRDDW